MIPTVEDIMLMLVRKECTHEQALAWMEQHFAAAEEEVLAAALRPADIEMRINDAALNEAGWALVRCAGPAIHANRCKEVAREVIRAYISSFARVNATRPEELSAEGWKLVPIEPNRSHARRCSTP